MPWATPLHTSGPPESPCGQRGQGLSSSSLDLFSLPPWGGWSLLGALADKRVFLVLRFQSGPDNPPPPTGSLCPYMTVEVGRGWTQDRDQIGGQAWDRGTGFIPTAPHPPSSADPRFCMGNTGNLTKKESLLLFESPAHICMMGM